MTEGYINIAQVESDEELETAAVAGAAAVQRLVADRNNLRDELAASRAAQEELRRRLATQHQRYIEKRIVARPQLPLTLVVAIDTCMISYAPGLGTCSADCKGIEDEVEEIERGSEGGARVYRQVGGGPHYSAPAPACCGIHW